MSTHGLQWFSKCYNNASLDALANDWKADLLRTAMYVQEDGYETDPAGFTNKVNGLVDMAEARGMYALIDFHTLTPGDPPNYNLDRAKTFFASVAARNAAKKNVIYEIANEPNGVSWAGIKSYAEQVIPVIRAADPDAVVVVGTRGWSSLGVSDGSNESEVVNSPRQRHQHHVRVPLLRRQPQGQLPRDGEPGRLATPALRDGVRYGQRHRRRRARPGEHHRLAGPARPAEDQLRELDLLRRQREQCRVQARHL